MTEKLTIIQDQFVEALYDEKNSDILKLIKTDEVPKEELIDIYRDGVKATLINALRITYPQIDHFLKKEKFDELCLRFIKENRSKSGNLDDYGGEFSGFLAKESEFFLSDIAKLEWFMHKSYLAADVGLFDLPALQKLPPEILCDVKFNLNPAVFLMTSNYNLFAKRKQSKESKKENYVLIYRNDLEVEGQKIPKSEFNFLKGAKEGLTFYEICDKYDVDIQSCLQKYISNQVLSDFSV